MKFILLTASALILATSCKQASQEDYENMTADMCDCFSPLKEDLSNGMQEAIIESANTNGNFEEVISDYAMQNPSEAMADATVLMSLEDPGNEIQTCIAGLETKYKDIKTMESETEVQNKIIEILEKREGCELTYALVKLGLSAQ